jgi:transcriptional regulator with XRE-family HTH domain
VANEFGEFLEGLRGRMSLRKAAEKSGLSHTYIRDLELGVNRATKTPIRPTPETLEKLSKAYDYKYEELMKKAGYLESENTFKRIIDDQTKNDISERISRLPPEEKKIIDDMLELLENRRKN